MRVLSQSNISLEILGTGELEPKIRTMIKTLNLNKSVRLAGYVPREQLPKYYNAAHIFVLPSLSESFGQVLLEAMSCGLPIVATHVGGIPEVLHDGKGGKLIEPANHDAIVNAVQCLASNSKIRRSMGEYNRQMAVERYQWSRVAGQYEQLYIDSVDSRHDDL